MRISDSVKPISYFKAHASEMINQINENQQTMVITQNGEAKAVIQDIQSYDNLQESLALMKILVQSQKSVNDGKVKPLKQSFDSLRSKIGLAK